MTYMINARLERGVPALTLIDAMTGEERLHWRSDNVANGKRDWQGLFKQLILLCCADQLSLVQRAKSPVFGDACIECSTCVDQGVSTEIQTHTLTTETKNTDAKDSVISLLKLQR